MALIKCPECGRDISDKANACVHCGYPLSKVADNAEKKESNKELTQTVESQETLLPNKAKKTVSNKTKVIIAVVCILVLALIITICVLKSNHDKKMAQQRDLSTAFDFSFSMTMEDVITYEASTFGNTVYEYDSEVNRLDFDSYYGTAKHMYFFDKETGLLRKVTYRDSARDYGDEQDPKCNHIEPIKRKILNIIGDWDSNSHSKLFYYAVGQVDGVDIKIQYETGVGTAIVIYTVEQ